MYIYSYLHIYVYTFIMYIKIWVVKQATFRSPRDIYPNLQHPCHSQELEEMRQEVQKKQLELQAVKNGGPTLEPFKVGKVAILTLKQNDTWFYRKRFLCCFFGLFHL